MRLSRRARQKAAEREWQQLLAAKRADRAPTFAVLGASLTGVAVVFRYVGIYHLGLSMRHTNFGDMSDTQTIKKALMGVTRELAYAGNFLGLGDLVLLVGGSFFTYALHAGAYRELWCFWAALAFSLFFVWQPFVRIFFGSGWLWLLVTKRSEFFAKQAILVTA